MAVIYQSDDIIVRYATEADHSAVLAINDNIYDGLDYMPEQYQAWIQNPNTKAYVLEKDGEIISFIMTTLLDNGKTVLSQSGRTKPEFTNSGYSRYLGSIALEDCLRRNPQVNEMVGVTRLNLLDKEKQDAIDRVFDISFKMNCKMFQTDSIQNLPTLDKKDIAMVTGKELIETLLNHRHYLFDSYMQVEYIPFQNMEGNILPIVNRIKPVCFVSRDYESVGKTYRGISFHTSYKTMKRGMICHWTYYGPNLQDMERHFCSHLRYLRDKVMLPCSALHMNCTFPLKFAHSTMHEMAIKYNLKIGILPDAVNTVQKFKHFDRLKDGLNNLSKL